MFIVTYVLFAILCTLFDLVFICKGKGHPRTGREGQEGEFTNSSTFSLTSSLSEPTPRPGSFSPGKTRYAFCMRLGGPQGRSGWVLYRLSYRGPCSFVAKLIIYVIFQS